MSSVREFDVFLSYASLDEAFVRRLKAALESQKLRVWLDRDEIVPGDLFPSAIELALTKSSAVAFVVSPESLASGWVKEEYNSAIALSHRNAKELRLIPVLLNSADLPPFLASRQWADFRDEGKFNDGIKSLIAGIRGQPSAQHLTVKRVCFLSSEYPPIIFGGLGIHVDKLTAALSKHLALDIVLPDPGKQQYQPGKGVRPVSVSVGGSYSDSSSWRRFAEYVPSRIGNLVGKDLPDIIHCHDWVTVLAGIKCKWQLGIPLIFHMHLPNRDPLCAYIENLGLISADLVTVNSEAMYVEITDRGLPIRKLQVVRNGVDTDIFKSAKNWPTDGGYILFVGRLVEQKGVEYLLRAFCYVRDKFPDVRLKIAGDGEFREWLERLCENLMLSSHVEFLGWMQQDELPALYAAARLVVVPSVFEPFGMVALEAFASKRPVVASRVGGLREIVQHNSSGFLAEPKDHLDLAQWLMTLLADSEMRHRMGEAGLARISDEGYTWPAVAEQFLELYEQINQSPANLAEPQGANSLSYQIEQVATRGEKRAWWSFLLKLFAKGSAA
jgi:glycogen(starch) synthase